MSNEKIVSPVPKMFSIQHITGIAVVLIIFLVVLVKGLAFTSAEKENLYYEEGNLANGITIKEADKSAFETLTDKDIENQFNEVVGNLTINQSHYNKTEYSIDTRNIGVKNPFITGSSNGNKYIDKDILEKLEAEKAQNTNQNEKILEEKTN